MRERDRERDTHALTLAVVNHWDDNVLIARINGLQASSVNFCSRLRKASRIHISGTARRAGGENSFNLNLRSVLSYGGQVSSRREGEGG